MKIGYLTQVDELLSYPVEWKDMVSRKKKLLALEYTYEELKEEVNKRTSFLGKHRSTESASHLLDVVALTEDESPLFDSYLQSVAAEVYDSFSKFSGEEGCVYECGDDGIQFVVLIPENTNETMAKPLDVAVKDSIVYGIIFNWLLMSKPDEADVYSALYAQSQKKVRERSNTLNQPNYSYIAPRPY